MRACPSYSEDCTYPNEAGRTPLEKGASVSYGNRDRLPCQQVSACIGGLLSNNSVSGRQGSL